MTVWSNHRQIVVGIDGSENSFGACRWAADVAARLRLPMHLLSAMESRVMAYREFDISGRGDWDDYAQHAARAFLIEAEKIVSDRAPGVEVTTEVSGDFVTRALLNNSDHAHMLVVGRSGLGSLGGALVGSTTQLVVDQAGCPVVVWPGSNTVEPGTRPVTVGIDGSALSIHAVDEAFAFAAAFGAPVVAVHTWSAVLTAGVFKIPVMLDWNAVNAAEAAVLSEALAGKSEQYPEVAVQRVLREGSPAHTLMHASEDNQLIVVGSRGHTGLVGAIAGSTSRNLLYHANVPLMVCRPPRR
ncbi:universal stress protein [Rhodococcoides fascians]|uniref:universal stress protein n=1 Tax=Rhodococcoides fascians TaxID=1828 RepID=UPI00056193D7|nr:universal stress protein [Rhodococcus fascians]